jgi:hypothetical protein
MFFSSWLRNRNSNPRAKRATAARPKDTRFRPLIETLEDRCVPSTLVVDHDWDNNAPANVPAPQGTVEWAVANAQNGDTILITGDAVNHGINLTHGELLLTQQNLTIETAANKSPATINGDNLSRIFEVAAGASVTLSNLVITGGMVVDHGGGILVDSGAALTVSGCTVSGNQAGNLGSFPGGGGIENDGTLTVTGSIVTGNTATGFGGGIFNRGTATVSNSTLTGNGGADTQTGGGIGNYLGMLTISGCALSDNSSETGGGIANIGGMLMVSGCTLSGNSAYDGGGIFSGGTMTVTGSTLSGNSASYICGGIDNRGTATVSNSTLTGNSATFGGGIINIGGTLYLDAFTVANIINNKDTSGLNGPTANIDATYTLI